MINEHIVEGLRHALAKGQNLEQAMMSFWNAGYKKEDIEESARSLAKHPDQPLSHPEKEIPEHIKKPATKVLPVTKPFEKPEPEEKPEQEKQKISRYEEKTKPRGKLITILLIIFLFIIISSLAGIFIFKQELIEFFSRFV